MNTVGYHGTGMRHESGHELSHSQKQIYYNTDRGNMHGNFLVCPIFHFHFSIFNSHMITFFSFFSVSED